MVMCIGALRLCSKLTPQRTGGSNIRPKLLRKPKNEAPPRGQSDGDSALAGQPCSNPAVGDVPIDIIGIGFTALEKDMYEMVTGPDDWSTLQEPDIAIPGRDRSALTSRHLSLESWMSQHRPLSNPEIEPWILYYMDQSNKAFPREVPMEATYQLSKKGSSNQRLLSVESVSSPSSAKDGHQLVTQSYWGVVQRHGDFPSPELTLASFDFQFNDIGDSIPLTDACMRSTGNTENAERNPCDMPHLDSGILRNESGREGRDRERGRVFTMTHELRQTELRNALLPQEAFRDDIPLE